MEKVELLQSSFSGLLKFFTECFDLCSADVEITLPTICRCSLCFFN